jgi:hypothetical protein
VLWRKGSFGSDSAAGSRFAERLLTVVATCRQQGRPLLDFLVAAGEGRAPGNVSSIAAPGPAGIDDRLRSRHHRRAERLPHGLPYRETGLRECYAAVLDALERASQRAPEGVG